MISPRATCLVRVADLQAFREAVVSLATAGPPLHARDRLVIVPTRAAAAHLVRTIEDACLGAGHGAVVLPDLITSGELVERLATRIDVERPVLTDAEREVILSASCRAARDGGAAPPFRLRPGLVAETLRFYDTLRRNQKDVDTFERLTLGVLEPGASYDRGAERLVRQTRFLAAAFREFERRCAGAGFDEHVLRRLLLESTAARPFRHVVITVADRASDPHGLEPADWDLLSRLPGLERLDVVVTDRRLAGTLHERIHRLLPGIDEVRFGSDGGARKPLLLVRASRRDAHPSEAAVESGRLAGCVHADRDREEEVASFARRVKHAFRRGGITALDRVALVVHQPLPYVYVARDVLRAAGIPSQMFDTLPLAAEPYAAAVDVVFSVVAANFARVPSIELLRSPHFRFAEGSLSPHGISALDRALSEAGYLGGADALERLVEKWRAEGLGTGRLPAALPAAEVLLGITRKLSGRRTRAPMATHLRELFEFLSSHDRVPEAGDLLMVRHLRARGAVLGMLSTLRGAYARFDNEEVEFEEAAALLRRWIEAHTFAPRAGESGVHVVDDRSAPFGDFEYVQLAGLVDGEWPERPRRNIFYSAAILRELGWPAEADRLDGARSAFADLLRLPSACVAASTFLLEADSLVSPSPLIDEIDRGGLEAAEVESDLPRTFSYEALGLEPINLATLQGDARSWADVRLTVPPHADPRFKGLTSAPAPRAYSLSALERYQDCPFKFFAADVLGLEEAPEDEYALSPRARGRFVHAVFQRFFEAWDTRPGGAITAERFDEARSLFASVAEPLLAGLPESDAVLERTRLFGSAISVGIVDVVLGLEAERPTAVRERWLEYRFEGQFSLGADRRVPLKGVADRIDLLEGNRLRVIDYKSGSAPNARRALQVPVYALCAQELLSQRDGAAWTIGDAAYIAFSGKRSLVSVIKTDANDVSEVLAAARGRLFDVVDGVAGGEFPPRPHDEMICRYCAYSPVCRKDYVGDE